MKLLIRQRANLARLALPDQRCLIFAPGLNMTVEAVVREVEFASGEPLRPGAIPLKNLVPLLEPVELSGNASPKLLWLLNRFAVHALVLVQSLNMRFLAEVFRALKLPLLLQNGINVRRCLSRGGLIRHSLFLTGLG